MHACSLHASKHTVLTTRASNQRCKAEEKSQMFRFSVLHPSILTSRSRQGREDFLLSACSNGPINSIRRAIRRARRASESKSASEGEERPCRGASASVTTKTNLAILGGLRVLTVARGPCCVAKRHVLSYASRTRNNLAVQSVS